MVNHACFWILLDLLSVCLSLVLLAIKDPAHHTLEDSLFHTLVQYTSVTPKLHTCLLWSTIKASAFGRGRTCRLWLPSSHFNSSHRSPDRCSNCNPLRNTAHSLSNTQLRHRGTPFNSWSLVSHRQVVRSCNPFLFLSPIHSSPNSLASRFFNKQSFLVQSCLGSPFLSSFAHFRSHEDVRSNSLPSRSSPVPAHHHPRLQLSTGKKPTRTSNVLSPPARPVPPANSISQPICFLSQSPTPKFIADPFPVRHQNSPSLWLQVLSQLAGCPASVHLFSLTFPFPHTCTHFPFSKLHADPTCAFL